ncbi:MAG: extracellular solute-binding protein [Oscillospiraceae bacterium]|nr:extracellular solute-binding protein [Oscillospiraceae bacterium]
MKKLIAIVLALVTVLSLCAACGGTAAGGEGGNNGDGEHVKLTIGLPTNARILSWDDNALTAWLEEKTGYELEFQPYSGGTDIATQISTAVAAQEELPDILMQISLSDSVINTYGRNEYFVDLSEYYADREDASKTFWERFEANLSEADRDNILRQMEDPETGAIYSVPTLETSLLGIMDYQMWINVEWLDKVGKEKPTNNEELLDVLRAFKTQDPNGNGKNDEIPLFGAQEGGLGADVINWLVNLFVYFNDRKNFNLDENGKLTAPFTSNEYREALKFINSLIKEGLMPDSVFSTTSPDMAKITTPASGPAICGIFAGHLTLHAALNNEILYQYEPLQTWGNAVYNDNTNKRNNFITSDCDNVDEAFNLMMTMWSEECSYRIRYGEYGVNWDEADEGAVSDLGLPCTFKIIRDPLMEQNTCMWFGGVACTLVVYSEGETAQLVEESSPWMKYKSEVHAESRRLFDEAAAKNNPPADQICPVIVFTEDEKLEDDDYQAYSECCSYYKTSRTDFCKGTMDPNSDADWNAYLAKLDSLGLKGALDLAQFAYERQL